MNDANGEPIIGATIKEKGTANGTASDLNAKFSLEVSPGAVLEISYIGYQTQEVKVGDRTSLSVTLAENQQILDEVVVVGYGTTSRKNLTTSIATVKTEKYRKQLPVIFPECCWGVLPVCRQPYPVPSRGRHQYLHSWRWYTDLCGRWSGYA